MDPLSLPARSWLFVPATRPERFAKAAASGADRVIVDLEDAVGPAEKSAACQGLLDVPLPTGLPVYLRVNGAATEWFESDIATAAKLAITGVLLPKADSAEQVHTAAKHLPQSMWIIPIAETARGVWNVMEVAQSLPGRIERLVFGALDFELDTGMLEGDETFAFARSRIALASRIAGIGSPIDAVCLQIDDDAMIGRDAARSRRFGFGGKLCIHPKQIAATNRAFAPSPEQLRWARGVLDECARRPRDAVFSYEGIMVDRPVIARARQIVGSAGPSPA